MPSVATPRDLLFGLLALQNGLIDQGALVAAFQAWTRDRARPLADHLLNRGDLDSDDRSAVEALVDRHLKKQGGDVEKSIAAIGVGESTRRRLAEVADSDLLDSLATAWAPTHPDGDPGRTATYGVGPAADGCGRFRIVRPHARGGLGAVFVAIDGELNREVALKQILDHHADDPTSRQRFLIEAEITGGLEHPGIVPVYGLGTYDHGRPYYAMRFVRGDTLKDAIGAFHDDESLRGDPGRRSLELRKLLRRFVDVCNAIDYAHSRGILHRDLKPANVIVGKHGETLVVDWGLAKPIGKGESSRASEERTLMPSSASGTAETLPGSAMGTPAYMSPEQAAGDLDHLGPRSDVYSLGATLYCLLTGRASFEGSDLGGVLRGVQKGDFPAPRKLDPSISPALEAICLKAMALKPADRYASARALAEDVERWSADEPVSAHRDPAHVRLARWARRHRTGVAIGAGLLQTAVVVLAVSTVLLGQSRARVERERRRAEAVNAFLVKDLLAQADPENNPADQNLTVRELLDKAARALEVSPAMKANPEVEGSVRSVIGNTYYGLGLFRPAREQLERAVACQDQSGNFPPAERIFTLNRLGWVMYKSGKAKDAEFLCLATLEKARNWLGPDHEETVYAADNIAAMTVVSSPQSAFSIYRENLAIQRRVLGPEHLLTLRAAHNLSSGLMRYSAGNDPKNVAEALEVMRSVRDAYHRTLGPDHPETLWNEEGQGFALARQGKFAEAREVLAPVRERSLKVLGPGHLTTGWFAETFALAEEGVGHLEAAETLLTEAYSINSRLLGDSHVNTLQTLSRLGRVCLARGKNDEAFAWYGKLLVGNRMMYSKSLGPDRDPSPARAKLGKSVDLLGDAFSGKADAETSAALLGELRGALAWLCWKGDWTSAYVGLLNAEAWLRLSRTSDKSKELRGVALPQLDSTLADLVANPMTPPPFLADARARVGRLREEFAGPASAPAP